MDMGQQQPSDIPTLKTATRGFESGWTFVREIAAEQKGAAFSRHAKRIAR